MRTLTYYAARATAFIRTPGSAKMLQTERQRLKQKPEKATPDALYTGARRAVQWLLHAQSQSPDGGFPTLDIGKEFGASYPETSGYILDTLLHWQAHTPSKDVERAIEQCAEWLLSIQHADGGWQSGYVDESKPPVVFNTAQVMRGLIHLWEKQPSDELANALDKASNWIVSVQEPPGVWAKHNYLGKARVYDTYVVAPLTRWAKIRKNSEALQAAEEHIHWVVDKQLSNGWFPDADNTEKHNNRPILHTIAYTIDGLLEYADLTGNDDARAAGARAAEVLAKRFLEHRRLPGRFDKKWHGSEAAIPSGCAQMVVAWSRLMIFQPSNTLWEEAVDAMCSSLLHMQWKDTSQTNLKGVLSGSFPFWGKYEPFRCPNWAVKYLVDALMSHPKFPEPHA